MTIEEQIAQLNAQIEELLPQHRAAFEAWAPVYMHAKELKRIYNRIDGQIRTCQEAIKVLSEPMSGAEADPTQYRSPLK